MKVIKDKSAKPVANWAALKVRLTKLDPAALVSLVHDLYPASKDKQTSFHARSDPGDRVGEGLRALWSDHGSV